MEIGAFRAKETRLECPRDGNVFVSEELSALVPEQCTFGFDVIVYVGNALFVHCRNVREIKESLAGRNISISENEVTFLGKKFILYLAAAHRESSERLRDSMTKRGGYILHVDGTCEGNSPHLFSGMDGMSEFVLDNIKIPSEKKELLVPFFHQVKDRYGDPIALVHDMGKGILTAVEEVFPGTPDFICHFHFLRDIGKDLFGEEYKVIFNRLKKHGIRTKLRQKLKALEKAIRGNSQVYGDLKTSIEKGQIETLCLEQIPAVSTYALIHWIFDASRMGGGYGFPFDSPHFDFFQRLKAVHCVLKQIQKVHLRDKVKDNRPFFKLWNMLNNIVNDKTLARSAAMMEEKIAVFNELRQALRIALPDGKDGLNDDGIKTEMATIEKAVKHFRAQQVANEPNLCPKRDYLKMIAQIDKYWDKLFADPIMVNTHLGPVSITPQRTNNILERFFRRLKRYGRKRSGTASLNNMLKTILADTPLVSNLRSEEYRQIILNGRATLAERFSQIDAMQVREQLKQAQQTTEKFPTEMTTIINQENLPKIIAHLFDQQRNTCANRHLRS